MNEDATKSYRLEPNKSIFDYDPKIISLVRDADLTLQDVTFMLVMHLYTKMIHDR